MKNRLLSIGVVLVVLSVAWTVYAAEGGAERSRRGGFAGMSAEDRSAMRERFQNMSEEERTKFREDMRARFENMSDEDRSRMRQRGGSRSRMSAEDQLKSIVAMEGQLGKLKASIASSASRSGVNYRDMSEEERTKLREQSSKSRADREGAIVALRAELDKLSPPRATPGQMEVIAELREIGALAKKEEATETTKRLSALIEKQTQLLSPTRSRRGSGAPGEGRQRGERGERGGGARRSNRATDEDK